MYAIFTHLRTELVHDQPSQPPDIRDPWEGPRTFAEDFYAGGDRPLDSLTPSYLTPREEEPLVIPGITSSGDKVESPKAPSPETREVFDVDELYADVTASGPTPTSNVPVADEPMPEYGPSLPLAAVDWNFPAAFPGKKATGSGYLVVDPDEFVRFDLSYDEDQYSAVADGSSSKNTQQEGDMSTAQGTCKMLHALTPRNR